MIKAVLFLFLAAVAAAANLTVGQAIELRAGLQQLDGAQQVVPQGDQPAKVVNTPYQFSSDARWKIFQALTALKPVLETFEAARVDLVKRMQLDGETDPKKLAPFTEAINKDLKRTQDIKLPTITKADLQLDKNQIPGSVLEALAPILKE